ncbi:hypothetical protein B5X24_HaOG200812 [Helicoverpa armigera]|nr:hypothetical protein B5X24_HaOG200812 [Helicoverpa armigera]
MDNSVYKLLSLRLLFGHYFKLSSSKWICYIAKIFCFSMLIVNFAINCILLLDFTSFDISQISLWMLLWIMLVESSSSILISLYTDETYLLKFSAKIKNYVSSPTPCRATYVMASFIIPLNFSSVLIAYLYEFGVAVNIFYNISYTTCYCSYLTSLYITEMYAKAINNLTSAIVNRLKDINISDEEKRVCIENFLDNYLKLLKIYNATMTVSRINVSVCKSFE